MTPDELALRLQAQLKATEQAIKLIHMMLSSMAVRSADGQNLTKAGLTALGIDPASPVPDDAGPGGPGTGKTPQHQ